MASCQLPQCVRIGIDPIAAHLGGFNLYWYGVLVAVGVDVEVVRVGVEVKAIVGVAVGVAVADVPPPSTTGLA
jgi:prolipoprotein diacylglyceryltransferase